MVAGIGLGQLWGLVREVRSSERREPSIVVSGPGADRLAAALGAGGEAGAVRVGADPARAAASVVVLGAAPTATERDAMRRVARAGAALVVVRVAGFGGAVPYALPSDVIDAAADDIPLAPVAAALAAALPDEDAVALAGRLPTLREAVQRRVIGRTALANAAVAVAPWIKQAHLPLMTLAQGRMLLVSGIAAGNALPREPQRLAATAGVPLAAALGAGIGLRALVRRLPVRGPLVAAAVAYAGTRALGEARSRLP